jgi:hypothetical protein
MDKNEILREGYIVHIRRAYCRLKDQTYKIDQNLKQFDNLSDILKSVGDIAEICETIRELECDMILNCNMNTDSEKYQFPFEVNTDECPF